MMQKIYSFFIVFLGIVVFGQTQNHDIYDTGGQRLEDTQRYCAPKIFNLVANPAAAASGGYDVSVVGNVLSKGSRNVTFGSTVGNEHFSIVYDFPAGFNFQMYGKVYTKYAVGSSGRIILGNGSELDNLKNLPDVAPTVQIPSSTYLNFSGSTIQNAQIYFGYSPRNYSQSGDYLKILRNEASTYNGHPEVVVSISGVNLRNDNTYNKVGNAVVHLVSGTNEILTQYYETTSDERFIAGQIQNNSVLGIQNEFGDKGKWPSVGTDLNSNDAASPYRFGKWENTYNVYKFSPALKQIQKYEWLEDGSQIGTENTLTYTANGSHTLKLIITYTDGTTQESSVTFNEISAPDKPEFSANLNTSVCPSKYEFAITNPQTGVTYHWYKDGTEFPGAATAIGNSSGNYYVIADNGCKKTESEHRDLTLSSEFPAIPFENNHIFPDCDNAGRPDKNFDLFAVTGYSAGAGYTVTFSDDSGNITNPTTYKVTSGTPKTVTMNVKSTTSSCEDTKVFTINYQSFPENNKTFTAPKLCFGDSSYSVEEFKSDFPEYSNFDVQFSVDGAAYSTVPVNPSANNSVFVKISKTGFSCSSAVKLNFEFYPEIIVKTFTQFPEHCFSETEYFDLKITKSELEYDDVTAEFYKNYDAATQTFSDQITDLSFRPRNINKIYVKLMNSHGCVYPGTPPILEFKIYPKPKLLKTDPEIKYSECGSTVFNLTTNISDYIGAWSHYSEIRYFDGSGVRLSQSEWENYDFAQRGQPTMKFVYNSTDNLECANDMTFNLIFKRTPSLTKTQIPVCAETSIPRADFIREIIGTSNYKVTDENGSPLPENFTWAALPATVKVILEDNVTHCKSGVLDVTIYQPAATVLLARNVNSEQCDMDSDRFDGYFSFDLNALKSQISADANAKFELFDNSGTKINSPYTNKTKTEETITAKVTSDGFCPSIATLKLKVKSPSKSSALKDIYYLCAGELTIDAGSENNIFAWSDGQTTQIAKFTKAGNYSVILTNSAGCSYTHNFIISDEDQPKISSINQTSDKIEVTTEGGEKPYTYYFNGISNGNNPVLLNPTAPEYIIRVVSANGCYREDKSVYFITLNNVITPNGDGKNDIWKIENLNHPQMENVEVIIADRYGKTVYHTTKKDDISWDGTYNGRVLPTASYWYVVKWHDTETKKSEVRQGWILLQNRD